MQHTGAAASAHVNKTCSRRPSHWQAPLSCSSTHCFPTQRPDQNKQIGPDQVGSRSDAETGTSGQVLIVLHERALHGTTSRIPKVGRSETKKRRRTGSVHNTGMVLFCPAGVWHSIVYEAAPSKPGTRGASNVAYVPCKSQNQHCIMQTSKPPHCDAPCTKGMPTCWNGRSGFGARTAQHRHHAPSETASGVKPSNRKPRSPTPEPYQQKPRCQNPTKNTLAFCPTSLAHRQGPLPARTAVPPSAAAAATMMPPATNSPSLRSRRRSTIGRRGCPCRSALLDPRRRLGEALAAIPWIRHSHPPPDLPLLKHSSRRQ